jgi:hypothetical protein
MSSNFVFNSLGLFPKLGSDLYYLHGPRHPRTVIRLENGKRLEILAANAGPGRPYIAEARFNGAPLAGPFVSQAQLLGGGVLSLTMSAQPGRWIYEGAVLPASADQPALIDGKTSTVWKAAPGQSATFTLAAPACVGAYSVSVGPGGVGPERADPTDWSLLGFDGRRWTVVDQRRNEVFAHPHATRTFPLKPARYSRMRLALKGAKGADVSEVELIAGAGCRTR